MLLHQRANHQSCRPETITAENQYACHDLSARNKRQHSLLSQNVDPSIACVASVSVWFRSKIFIATSGILARSKSRVLLTDPLFIPQISLARVRD